MTNCCWSIVFRVTFLRKWVRVFRGTLEWFWILTLMWNDNERSSFTYQHAWRCRVPNDEWYWRGKMQFDYPLLHALLCHERQGTRSGEKSKTVVLSPGSEQRPWLVIDFSVIVPVDLCVFGKLRAPRKTCF